MAQSFPLPLSLMTQAGVPSFAPWFLRRAGFDTAFLAPLKRITGAAGYTYTYDADGNRVEKSNGSTGTIYWYMSPGIVAESDLTGNLKSEYVFFDGDRVARKDFPGNSVFYYFSDHLKTASVITDSAGTIKEDEDYYPWGGELQFVNNDSNHYKFTSKERDSETGLDYFGARYYGNWLGRFITPDWSSTPVPVPYADLADPQSLNQYSYVRNVPTSQTDGDGHCPVCPEIEQIVEEIVVEHPQVAAAIANTVDKVEDVAVGAGKFGLRAAGTTVLVAAYLVSPGSGSSGKNSEVEWELANQGGGKGQNQTHGQTQEQDSQPEPQTSTSGAGARKGGGPKATDYPGVTAGGQATDKHGNKIAPSGRAQINITKSNTREQARNRALSQGSGAVEHRNPRRGRRHFHPKKASGNKVPNNPHHEF